jgi:hypothetical protein
VSEALCSNLLVQTGMYEDPVTHCHVCANMYPLASRLVEFWEHYDRHGSVKALDLGYLVTEDLRRKALGIPEVFEPKAGPAFKVRTA